MVINNVRTIAEGKGFSITTLAQSAGIAYNTTRQMWLGYTRRIDHTTLEKLCAALHVTVGDLFEVRPEDAAPKTTKPTR